MDTNKEYRIALVLYTDGLDYDDRVRKEIQSIQGLYPKVSFKIFAVEPHNREESGISSYGVPYRIPFLKSREKYASGTHTLAKAWDFYKKIRNDLKSFDAVWCADPETFIFVLMVSGKPILWDLHELPMALMGNPFKKVLFHRLEKRCKVMVHANEERLNFLHSAGMVKQMQKQFYLRNYPQHNEIDKEYDELYKAFKEWKGASRCVYLQGLMDARRADVESLEGVVAIPGLKGVVVGRILPNQMERFNKNIGEEVIKERFFFTGQIKQLKTPQYIRECSFSLIFYKNVNPNNWYCEPNRLFQSLNNGIPVVVGNNPPMKELVNKYKVGVCADTDGSDKTKIADAIKNLLDNESKIRENVKANGTTWIWSQQDDTIQKIVEAFLQ